MNSDTFNSMIKKIVDNELIKAEFSEDLTINQLEILANVIKKSSDLEHLVFKKKLTDEQLAILAEGLKENTSINKIELPDYSTFYNKNILIQPLINFELLYVEDKHITLLWDLKKNPSRPFVNKDDFLACFKLFPLIAVLKEGGLQFLLRNLSDIPAKSFYDNIQYLYSLVELFKLYEHPIKLPKNYLSTEQFIHLTKISLKLADIIITITDFSQQINAPDDISSILKINRPLAEKIIFQNKDLQEIIKIQNLAEKYPALLNNKNLNKRDLVSCGLKESDVYHEKLLYQIGYIFCRDFIDLISPITALYIPIAKMIIDVLNKKPIHPSTELIKTYALQCERMANIKNPQLFFCKSIYNDSKFFSYDNTGKLMKVKEDMIDLITSFSDNPFSHITFLLLSACNQLNVGKYDNTILRELVRRPENNTLYTEVFSKLNTENKILIENEMNNFLNNSITEQRSPRMRYR